MGRAPSTEHHRRHNWHLNSSLFGRATAVRRAIILFALSLGIFGLSRIAETDVRVTSLSPSCAAPGDTVVLTGNGLGAMNVVVTVGGVRAQVLSATGNRVTFVVPSGVPSGVTTVTATNPGGPNGSTVMRIKGPEICGNQVDENCNGVIDDPDVCHPVNHPPVANAGPAQTVQVGQSVQLNGGTSSDPDGNPLTYQWSFTARPTGSTATLANPTSVTPSFTVDKAGTYTIQLIVNDGQVNSAPSSTTVSTTNSPPVANAGPDQNAPVGTIVQLSGAASSDVDGDPLTYQWTFVSRPAGSSATLTAPTTVTPSFTIDKAGDYVIQLVVNDGTVNSAPDTITVSTLNTPPEANAGPDQSAHVGETVQLDGSASSDADGNTLIYQWSLTTRPTGSTATLSDATTVQPTFTLDKAGTYVAQLVVNDGIASSAPDSVTISTLNTPPVANAGPDQGAHVGDTVQLDGSASSDADGNPLTYQWDLLSKPAGSAATLVNPTAVNPTVTIDKAGTYTVQLIVNDGKVDSAPDTIVISTLNTPPVANAGPDQSAVVGTTVQLDGTASSDVDGDPLTYRWAITAQPAGSLATLSDPTALKPTFTVDKAGTYSVQLIVNDGTVDSTPATVTISTLNSKPVANAGPDQSAHVGATVHLDGSASSDADGDPLTYRWALTTRPAGSAATLLNATTVAPTFVVDKSGTYIAQLIVNDGTVDSDPASVTISTLNSKPVADAGPDQTATTGTTVQLDGSGSSDADHDPLTYRWSFTTVPTGSTAALTGDTTVNASFVPDKAGTYVVQIIVNDGTIDSDPDTALVTVTVTAPANHPPVANAGPDQSVRVGTTVRLDGSASSDQGGDPLTFRWTLVSQPVGSTAALNGPTTVNPTFVPDVAGSYSVQLIVNDSKVDSAPATVTITATANHSPVANAGPDQNVTVGATVTLDGSGSSDPNGNPLTYQWTLSSKPAGSTATLTNATTVGPSFVADVAGTYVAQLVVNDGLVNSAPDTVTVTAQTSGGGLPPDPATVAPSVDRSVATDVATTSAFLYTGSNPIQTGVAPGTIEAKRAAVLRGQVLTRAGQALSGATVSIVNHPEFGQTLSRADGRFDLAVNGGGLLTVSYQKTGFFTAQRQIDVPWQDYAVLPDVVLVAADPQVTTVDLTAATPMQAARGSVQSDADGTRQATLLFPQGTQAQIVMPDGSTRPLTTLSVRATEFTVGPTGLQAMPADLPPNSAYTYAVVFTADEAKAAGATNVVFAQPLPFYVENFLNFPVGTTVPLGAYDASKGSWVTANSGQVIKIVSITSGLADLDTDGNGTVDNGTALGITNAERQQLAGLYPAGQSLWRVVIPHFDQPWDANWGKFPPNDGQPPKNDNPHGDDSGGAGGGGPGAGGGGAGSGSGGGGNGNCSSEGNSTITCQTQVLGEDVALTGAPFSLHYASDRVPGRIAKDRLQIFLSGASLPGSLKRIDLEVDVAGQHFTQSFPPTPNQSYTFTWDGKDVYGRTLQGAQPITVRIGNVYDMVYQQTSKFGYNGNGIPISGSRARQEVTL